MNAVDSSLVGAASGVNNAVSQIAALLAIALFGIVMNHVFNANLEQRLDALALRADVLQALMAERAKLGAMTIPEGLDSGTRSKVQAAIAESFVAGFRWVMALSALMAFASAAIAWAMITAAPNRRRPVPPPAAYRRSRRARNPR
jgi:hypothetical protein